jgi:hypothetical protein
MTHSPRPPVRVGPGRHATLAGAKGPSRWADFVIRPGCIAAAAAGQVEIGIPCVVGGALSSAALNYWGKD